MTREEHTRAWEQARKALMKKTAKMTEEEKARRWTSFGLLYAWSLEELEEEEREQEKAREREVYKQQLFDKAYRFEIEAIENLSNEPNPYRKQILELPNGRMLWEGVNEAVEEYYHEA